jgi:hypothetical protein
LVKAKAKTNAKDAMEEREGRNGKTEGQICDLALGVCVLITSL